MKKDVLLDLLAGKNVNCCGNCKQFSYSNKRLSMGEGICNLDDSFTFDFSCCNVFEESCKLTEFSIKTDYNKDFILNTMKEIAEKNDIKVIFSDDSHLKNYSCSSLGEIIFSTFDNLEYMFISFFHEFAHLKLKDKIPFRVKGYDWNFTSKMQFEIQVTIAGLNFAQKLGFIFSDDAVKWLLNENFSYSFSPIYGILQDELDENHYKLKQDFEIDKYLTKKNNNEVINNG